MTMQGIRCFFDDVGHYFVDTH